MLLQISHRSGNGDVRSVVASHGINGYCDIHQAILLRYVQLGYWNTTDASAPYYRVRIRYHKM
jgi:hypothetical protein